MRLKRFNESNNNDPIDINYIKECFAELYDREIASEHLLREYSVWIVIKIEPDCGDIIQAKIDDSKFYEYVESKRKQLEVLEEIETSIKRIADKYPDYAVSFDTYDKSIEILILTPLDHGYRSKEISKLR